MALHFSRAEFEARRALALNTMSARGLDAILMFKQESMYWLTGYDSFGYCFFQCLVLRADGDLVLLTRTPDLRQAQHTSLLEDIRIWVDRADSDPARQLCELLADKGLAGTPPHHRSPRASPTSPSAAPGATASSSPPRPPATPSTSTPTAPNGRDRLRLTQLD